MARGKYPQYYLMRKEERDTYPNGRYLKKDEIEVARRLAQKEYDLQILELLEKQEKAIQYFSDNYQEDQLNNVYRKLPEAKKRVPDKKWISHYWMCEREFTGNYGKQFERNKYAAGRGFV